MPATEKPLRLEFSVPQSGLTVNQLLERVRALPVAAASEALCEYQERTLTKVLGDAWSPVQVEPAPWACPKCRSQRGFSRRGSRMRKLRTSFGVVAFVLRQVTCLACKARGVTTTFSPFPELLGLAARARVSEELWHKAIDAATRIAFQQSSEITRVMTGQNLSAMAIHKEVQRRAQSVEFSAAGEVPILLLDSTMVKAGEKKRGVDLNLAVTVSAVSQAGNRSVLDMQVAALGTGQWTPLEEQLRRVKPRLILIDGEPHLELLATRLYPGVPIQRCQWHLARAFSYMLWRGKSLKWTRDELTAELRQILHTPQTSEAAKAALQGFGNRLEFPGEHIARSTILAAIDTAFTHLALPEPLPGGRQGRQAPIATSYIERQMREIDRRTDNGSRWTESGVLNILRLQVTRRLDPDQWARLWAC